MAALDFAIALRAFAPNVSRVVITKQAEDMTPVKSEEIEDHLPLRWMPDLRDGPVSRCRFSARLQQLKVLALQSAYRIKRGSEAE